MKSIREKIIDKVRKTGKMDSSIARKMFKEADADLLSSSIMRRTRELHSEGYLKRTERGSYVKTKKFDKKFSK